MHDRDRPEFPGPPPGSHATPMTDDPWAHRGARMRCATCMWFVTKPAEVLRTAGNELGRCRRHAPTMSGFPAVFGRDWCGDHKLDENRV
jgi:hypothetical protein